MIFGFGNQQTAWEKAANAVEDLLKAARELYMPAFISEAKGS